MGTFEHVLECSRGPLSNGDMPLTRRGNFWKIDFCPGAPAGPPRPPADSCRWSRRGS